MASSTMLGAIVGVWVSGEDDEKIIRPGVVIEDHGDKCLGIKVWGPGLDSYESHVHFSKNHRELGTWDWLDTGENAGDSTATAAKESGDTAGSRSATAAKAEPLKEKSN